MAGWLAGWLGWLLAGWLAAGWLAGCLAGLGWLAGLLLAGPAACLAACGGCLLAGSVGQTRCVCRYEVRTQCLLVPRLRATESRSLFAVLAEELPNKSSHISRVDMPPLPSTLLLSSLGLLLRLLPERARNAKAEPVAHRGPGPACSLCCSRDVAKHIRITTPRSSRDNFDGSNQGKIAIQIYGFATSHSSGEGPACRTRPSQQS